MSSDSTPDTGTEKRTIGAFDIRFIIGGLIGLYGIILTLLGIFNASDKELARGDGLNINLYAGLGMILVGVVFGFWAWKKPLILPEPKDDPLAPKA